MVGREHLPLKVFLFGVGKAFFSMPANLPVLQGQEAAFTASKHAHLPSTPPPHKHSCSFSAHSPHALTQEPKLNSTSYHSEASTFQEAVLLPTNALNLKFLQTQKTTHVNLLPVLCPTTFSLEIVMWPKIEHFSILRNKQRPWELE